MSAAAISSAEQLRTPRLLANLPAGRRVRAAGTHHQLGLQHGRQMAEAIHAFLEDRLARLVPLMDEHAMGDLGARVAAHARIIERVLPSMAEEVHGLAQGAAISVEQAYLLQLRRELTGFHRLPAQGDCTTFARLAPGGAGTVAQTIDLNGDMTPELSTLELTHTDGSQLAMASFTGLLGYLGVNDRGLAIGLNLVLAGDWQPGIPGYMVIRHLLDRADSVDEALEVLQGLPRASSRALTLCDGRRLVTAEYTPDEVHLLEGTALCHANHLLHPALLADDAINPFSRTSSLRRQRACEERLQALPVDAPDDACLALLASPPIDVPPVGDVRRDCTVASVLMRTDGPTLHVKQRGASDALH